MEINAQQKINMANMEIQWRIHSALRRNIAFDNCNHIQLGFGLETEKRVDEFCNQVIQ